MRARQDVPAIPRRLAFTLAPFLAGCAGVQSTFSAFGMEAQSTRAITIGMTIAGALIAIGVAALVVHAIRSPPGRLDHRRGMRVILWLGGIGPVALLTVLLLLSLPTMRSLRAEPNGLVIAVAGEQFWWRVRYAATPGRIVESANEIRVPVGRTVTFELASADVIHSFWIPGLAGKVDMIPGRTNTLVVHATHAGRFRGACAEFCGLSHARMALDVVALEAPEFDRWLAEAQRPAPDAQDVGRELFEAYGCDGCHAIRGHFAGSTIGPDLTHFGSRLSLGAGTSAMTGDAVARFIRDSSSLKPGSRMPAFRHMPPDDAERVAAYLTDLR
ncbi:MAG TPA: cytochrome c oxidase subunit II [Casimicrobiaceae bacterium]|nr:cytochrome c oxidase subunit II [Casimicrobiaceae bacterium]